MTLQSLAVCIDATTRTIDSVAMFDDPALSDEKRAVARLAIQHLSKAREYVEKLKELDR